VITQSLHEELEQVFNNFPNYCMKIMLGDCNEKLGTEDICRPTIGIERLYQYNNNNNNNNDDDDDDDDVRIVNFATKIM